MNDKTNDFFSIENNFDISFITVNDKKVWPILRMDYFFTLIKRGTKRTHCRPNAIKIIKDSFYGVKSWFKRYEYICFSNPRMRVEIEGKLFNVSLDKIVDILGQDKVLFIERPNPIHSPIDQVYSKNVVSARLLDLFSMLLRKVSFQKLLIINEKILNDIQSKYGIEVNYRSLIQRFESDLVIHKMLLKLYKPKVVFVTAYDSNLPAVKAARDLSIKIVELQHGLVNKSHPAYNSKFQYSDFTPEEFLAYGELDKNVLNSSKLFHETKIYVVGNFYLNHQVKNFVKNSFLENLKSEYTVSIGVSMQWTVSEKMIAFIEQLAGRRKDFLFIIIPRKGETFTYNSQYKNVIENTELNCYEVIQHMDFHTTVYSTCALEAPSLGIRNILINIEDLTKQHIGARLFDSHTKIVNSVDEYIETVERMNLQKETKEEIMHENTNNYMTNYDDNIREYVNLLSTKEVR